MTITHVTPNGMAFVRTPDERFTNLPDFPYSPNYVEINGLRMAYIDEGPREGGGDLVPSW